MSIPPGNVRKPLGSREISNELVVCFIYLIQINFGAGENLAQLAQNGENRQI